MQSERYYEAHITVEPSEDWEKFASISRQSGWRASKFDQDDVDDMSGKWFLSSRGTELEAVKHSMAAALLSLNMGLGLNVIRWKIEDTLLDSKHGDTLEMLSN